MKNFQPTMFAAVAVLEDGDYALVLREEHHAEWRGPSPVYVMPYGSTVPVIDWVQKINEGEGHAEWLVAFNRPGTPGVWLASFDYAGNEPTNYHCGWTGIDPRHEWLGDVEEFNVVDIEAFTL